MQKKYDVTALGEILIDFTAAGKNADGKNIYEENPGGAPANCAAAVAKLGGASSFIGMTKNSLTICCPSPLDTDPWKIYQAVP